MTIPASPTEIDLTPTHQAGVLKALSHRISTRAFCKTSPVLTGLFWSSCRLSKWFWLPSVIQASRQPSRGARPPADHAPLYGTLRGMKTRRENLGNSKHHRATHPTHQSERHHRHHHCKA